MAYIMLNSDPAVHLNNTAFVSIIVILSGILNCGIEGYISEQQTQKVVVIQINKVCGV